MIEKVFWMVWEPSSGYTRASHGTEAEAVTEAKRLARKEPAKRFYVLKALSFFECAVQPVAETMLFEPRVHIPSEDWLKARGE